jgi:hypothetical protein
MTFYSKNLGNCTSGKPCDILGYLRKMKKFYSQMMAAGLMMSSALVFFSCEKEPADPCANITCVNGNCINGPSCANEDRPVKITLNKIELTSFPQTNPQGGGWDSDGTGPDIYLTVSSGAMKVWEDPDYFSNAINTNTYTFTPSQPIALSTTEDLTILVFDYETFAADTQMGGVSTTGELWTSYLKGRGFPSTTAFSAGGFSFNLHWTYTH